MGKYIDWYLVEVEGMVRADLRADEARDALNEIESHLRESSSDLEARGMSVDEAELSAVERFGRASLVAAGLLERRVSSGAVRRAEPVRRIGLGLATASLVLGISMWLGPMHFDLAVPAERFWTFGAAALAISLWAGWRSIDRSFAPLAWSCLAGIVLGMLVAFPVGLRAFQVAAANRRIEAKGDLDRYAGLASQLERGVSVFTPSARVDSSGVAEFHSADGFLAPVQPQEDTFAHDPRGDYTVLSTPISLGPVTTFEEAKAAWTSRGQKSLDTARQRIDRYKAFVAAPTTPVLSYESVSGAWLTALASALMSVFLAAPLLCLHGLVASWRSPRRRSWVRRKLA